jgi:hypothetical protein
MKNKRMIYLKSVLFMVLSLLLSAATYAQSANFSGSWAYNESKSKLGEGGFRMISQKLTITQNENSFTLERSFTGQDGTERKSNETYTLDGKESVNPVFNTSKKSIATWSADKKSLTVASVMVLEMNGDKMEIKTTEIYSLNDANKSLSLNSHSTSSMGDRTATLVYDKK